MNKATATIEIVKGVEVAAPESTAPEIGQEYFLIDLLDYQECFCVKMKWGRTAVEMTWLERGLVYLNQEDCTARAKAILMI